jgi:TolB-like protein
VFGQTKSKPVGVGTLIVLLPFVPLSNGPKIDYFSHSVVVALDGNGLRFSSALT